MKGQRDLEARPNTSEQPRRDWDATLEELRRVVPFAEAFFSTTLPRGGLQICQPAQPDGARLRSYGRLGADTDPNAWHALRTQAPVALSLPPSSDTPAIEPMGDPLPAGNFDEPARRFAELILHPIGLAHAVAVPLKGPLLPGYDGLIHLFRTEDASPFTPDEMTRLAAEAALIDKVSEQIHASRTADCVRHPLIHSYPDRQIVVDPHRQILLPSRGLEGMDAVLRENVLDVAHARLRSYQSLLKSPSSGNGNGLAHPDAELDDPETASVSTTDRLLVPDSRGDCWPFRLSIVRQYPGLTGNTEPVAFVSLQPECEAWQYLTPEDFAADEDVARLIPAIGVMHENFRRGISLQEIARTVHLSPFHFHRRFTELLGITPKHYLFDCQINEAKRLLYAGDMDLSTISKQCGFAHQSHFTSRFKQATGLTPTKWRRLAQSLADA